MKSAVFVTAIPDMDWVKTHGDMCLEVIRAYLNRHGREVLVLDKNPEIEVRHNSWLWLLGHQIFPGYDYLLYWNLDILPNRFDVDIFDCLDLEKVAACRESDGNSTTFPHYRYNCGLVGMPKRYHELFCDIYKKWKDDPKGWPSWEQYYVNLEWGEQKIDVQEIPKKFNMMHGCDPALAACVHFSYSVYKDHEPLATTAIEAHYKRLKCEGKI